MDFQTINRRKLVQEVYDRRTLHRILNVDSRSSVVIDLIGEPAQVNGSGANGSSSVQAAWKARDHSDDESHQPLPFPSQPHPREVIDVDEESRYEIPPKKRRRLDMTADAHTMFTTDDDGEGDEDDGVVIHTIEDDTDDSIEYEEAEYALLSDESEEGEVRSGSKAKFANGLSEARDKRRAYWAAKGRRASPESSS